MKTYTRTAAIERARFRTTIYKKGEKWIVSYWREGEFLAERFLTHSDARCFRAQILIDTTLDLLGLTADIQYTGGDWTAFIPKEQ